MLRKIKNFYQLIDQADLVHRRHRVVAVKRKEARTAEQLTSGFKWGGANKSSNSKKTKVRNHYEKGRDLEHGNIDEKVNKDVKKNIEKVLGGI